MLIKIARNQGKVILTIWEVTLGFVMFSKLKDMLVAFLVDVPFTALPVKSRVRKISSSPMVFLYWFQCSTFLNKAHTHGYGIKLLFQLLMGA